MPPYTYRHISGYIEYSPDKIYVLKRYGGNAIWILAAAGQGRYRWVRQPQGYTYLEGHNIRLFDSVQHAFLYHLADPASARVPGIFIYNNLQELVSDLSCDQVMKVLERAK